MLCKYSTIFGEVGKGIHSVRIFNIAVIDLFLTLLGAFFLHLLIKKSNYVVILLFLVGCSIALHRLFCVRTTIDKLLFP